MPGDLRLPVAAADNADAPKGVLVALTGGPGQGGVAFVPRQRGAHARAAARLPPGDARPARHGRGGAALPGAAARGRHLGPHRPAARHRRGLRPYARPATGASTRRPTPSPTSRRCASRSGPTSSRSTASPTGPSSPSATRSPTPTGWQPARARLGRAGGRPRRPRGRRHERDRAGAARRVPRPALPRRPGRRPRRGRARATTTAPELDDTLVAMSVGAPSFPGVLAALREARAGRSAAPRPHRARRAPRPARAGAGPQPGPARRDAVRRRAAALGRRRPRPLAGREPALRAAAARTDPAPYDRATVVGNGFAQLCLRWPPTPAPPAPRSGDLPPVPTLLLAGDRDLSTPLPWAREQAAHTPQRRLVSCKGSGHSVQSRAPGGARPARGRALPAAARLAPVFEALHRRMRGRRSCTAQEEARALRSGEIGTRPPAARRAARAARAGAAAAPTTSAPASAPATPRRGVVLPFTDARQARARGRAAGGRSASATRASRPATCCSALAADPEAVELSSLDPARLRDEALRHLIDPPRALRPRARRARGRRRPGVARRPRAADRRPRPSARRRAACCWPCSAKDGDGARAAARARARRGRRSRRARRLVSRRRRRSSPTLREAPRPWRRGPQARW